VDILLGGLLGNSVAIFVIFRYDFAFVLNLFVLVYCVFVSLIGCFCIYLYLQFVFRFCDLVVLFVVFCFVVLLIVLEFVCLFVSNYSLFVCFCFVWFGRSCFVMFAFVVRFLWVSVDFWYFCASGKFWCLCSFWCFGCFSVFRIFRLVGVCIWLRGMFCDLVDL